MAAQIIQLKNRWQLGTPLAAGGFGQVYEATAEDGSTAVVKLVPKAEMRGVTLGRTSIRSGP
jgi:hypothetical protein